MQKIWTIEIKADFADPGKNEVIQEFVTEAAMHVHAVAALIQDGIKVEVAAWTNDYFTGPQAIDLLVKQKGDMLAAAVALHGDKVGEGSEISDEMSAALRQMQHDKSESP